MALNKNLLVLIWDWFQYMVAVFCPESSGEKHGFTEMESNSKYTLVSESTEE